MMGWQIPWVSRRTTACHILRGAHDHLPLLGRYRNGNHVLLYYFAEADACVEALSYNVKFFIADGDVEMNIRIGRQKVSQHRATQETFGNRGHSQTKPACGMLAHFSHCLNCCIHIFKRRTHRLVQALSSLSQTNASGCPLHESNPHSFLKPSDGLTDG
jgi:hypothetical protein